MLNSFVVCPFVHFSYPSCPDNKPTIVTAHKDVSTLLFFSSSQFNISPILYVGKGFVKSLS